MNLFDINAALQQARDDLERGDVAVRGIAMLLRGRLRTAKVSPLTLAALKRELQDFNMKTGNWKETK